MTKLLQAALTRVQALSSEGQDLIAALILEELADDEKWDRAFSASQDKLARMANEARSAIAAGKIRRMGIDEL